MKSDLHLRTTSSFVCLWWGHTVDKSKHTCTSQCFTQDESYNFAKKWEVLWPCLMVKLCVELWIERSSFEPQWSHCVVFLDKIYNSYIASLHPGVMVLANFQGNLTKMLGSYLRWIRIPSKGVGRVAILLVGFKLSAGQPRSQGLSWGRLSAVLTLVVKEPALQ